MANEIYKMPYLPDFITPESIKADAMDIAYKSRAYQKWYWTNCAVYIEGDEVRIETVCSPLIKDPVNTGDPMHVHQDMEALFMSFHDVSKLRIPGRVRQHLDTLIIEGKIHELILMPHDEEYGLKNMRVSGTLHKLITYHIPVENIRVPTDSVSFLDITNRSDIIEMNKILKNDVEINMKDPDEEGVVIEGTNPIRQNNFGIPNFNIDI